MPAVYRGIAKNGETSYEAKGRFQRIMNGPRNSWRRALLDSIRKFWIEKAP